MSLIETPVDVEERIASVIKESVFRAIGETSLEDVASRLGMHALGLESLLRSSRWNLPVAIRVAVSLGLSDAQRMEDALRDD